jgi:hypothetical protein
MIGRRKLQIFIFKKILENNAQIHITVITDIINTRRNQDASSPSFGWLECRRARSFVSGRTTVHEKPASIKEHQNEELKDSNDRKRTGALRGDLK